MTCIAVRIGKKDITIAGDTQASWGNKKWPLQDPTDKNLKANGKLFQVNGMTIGCAGSLAHIGLLQIFAKSHRPKEMERDFIIDWLIEFKEWANIKAKINFPDFVFHGLLVCDKRVFNFFDFVDASEIKDFTAVGSGWYLALGAMEVGASAEEAIRIAIKYDLYCGGEVTKITLPK